MAETRLRQPGSYADDVHRLGDAELVKRAQSKSSGKAFAMAAICALYDRYQNQIFRYLWSHLPDRESAEDLTGEVFTRMVASLPKYRVGEVPFRAWLYRIAHNLWVDHYRKNGRQNEVSLEQVDNLKTEAGDLEGTVESRLFTQHVREGLHYLPAAEHEVIVLRFFVGLSLQETSSILGKTLGAVKITQHRGLRGLREVLAKLKVEEN